jgi:hypothetical protein
MGERTRTFEESNQLRDWANLIMGEALLGSPWILSYSNDALPTWSARILGIVISILAIAALLKYAEWEEWLVLAAGGWLIVSPWAMGFADRSTPKVVHIAVGVVVVCVAAWELWDFRRLMAAREASARRQGIVDF